MDAHPPLPRWTLERLYAGADDPALAQALADAAAQAAAFRARYRTCLAACSAAELATALGASEALQKRALRPLLYATLLFSGDSRPDRHKALMARVREAWAALGEETLFFELELLRLPEARFAALAASPELAPWRHYLARLRLHSPYTLSEEVEQVIRRKDLSGKEAFAQLFDEATSALRFRFPFPGEETARDASGEELLALLYHPDRDTRRAAFTTFLDGHAAQELVLTACFNNLLLDHGREAELRGWPEPMTPAHLEQEMSATAVARLMEVTAANYELAREYFTLKRTLLGLDTLRNTDLYAPLTLATRSYGFDEARALVLEAFAGFSPELARPAAAFFAEGRIDAPPAAGKSGGAFCQGMMPGEPPWLLVNFTGTLRDLSTLAHELGHGVHYSLSQGQHLFHYHAPLPLAETASVFGEMLLTRHLLEREPQREVRIALLCAKLEEIIATTFRQNVLTRFELAAHRQRAQGLLSADDLCRLWWEENARLFGDAVEMIPAYRWGWSYIGHFIHSRFYCTSYIIGELLVLALYRRYRAEGPAFVPRYLELLARGGSAPPQELLAPFGIDLDDPGFWQQGYELVRELLAELKTLIQQG